MKFTVFVFLKSFLDRKMHETFTARLFSSSNANFFLLNAKHNTVHVLAEKVQLVMGRETLMFLHSNFRTNYPKSKRTVFMLQQ